MPPLALATLLTCGILILVLPRQYVLIPVLIGSIFVAMRVRVMIGQLDFYPIRILVLLLLARGLARSEFRSIALTKLDVSLIAFTLVCGLMYVIRVQTMSAFVYRSGIAFTTLGLFFPLRTLFRNLGDVFRYGKCLTIVLVLLAAGMTVESRLRKALFTPLGGGTVLAEREGGVRARGPFAHSSNAGIFAATSLPLVAAFAIQNKSYFAMGTAAAIAAVIASNSGGPAIALLYSAIGLGAWVFRNRLRTVRWTILIGLVLLHFAMNAPVWHLMTRVGHLTGGGGWHRAALVDRAIKHIPEWWLVGTSYTANWMPYARTADEADITNQFIRYGVDGGLISVILFTLVIVNGFKAVGSGLHHVATSTTEKKLLIWGLGASLLSHLAAFFCTSYFDQVQVAWILLLAIASSLTDRGFTYVSGVVMPADGAVDAGSLVYGAHSPCSTAGYALSSTETLQNFSTSRDSTTQQ